MFTMQNQTIKKANLKLFREIMIYKATRKVMPKKIIGKVTESDQYNKNAGFCQKGKLTRFLYATEFSPNKRL